MDRIAANLASRRHLKARRDVHLAKHSASPFVVRALAVVSLAALCVLVSALKGINGLEVPALATRSSNASLATTLDPKPSCREDEDDGRISYLELYYCTIGSAKVGAWFIIIPWAAFLFLTVGITAGDFFAVNLSSIARTLRMSDTFAGVTLLALGNGGPDIFSTWAAMTSNSPELAIGELIGGASFITLVIAGSLPYVKSFRVREKSLLRDALFLFITAWFLLSPLITKELHFWQGVAMIILYIIYVVFVMGYHWWVSNRTEQPIHASHDSDGGSGDITPTETRPLLQVQHNRQHRIHDPAPRQAGPAHMSPAIYREIGEWRRAHGRCIVARNDYMVQPSLAGSLEHGWRRRHAVGHVQNDPEIQESSHTRSEALPSSRYDRSDDRIFRTLFPAFRNVGEKDFWHILANIITSVPYAFLKIIIPVVDNEHDETCDHGWARWLLLVQTAAAPQFVWMMVWLQSDNPMAFLSWAVPAAWCLLGSAVAVFAIPLISSSKTQPRWHPFLSVVGFALSAFTLSTIADELVAIMKAIGVILGLSEAILGFTVFAIGNSVDDWVANITVAQHGHPVMALSACFGGPLLNILLGLGASTTYLLGKRAQNTGKLMPIKLHVDPVLVVSTGGVAATILILVPVLRFNRWELQKKIGTSLIAAWIGLTIANIALELT